MSHYMKVSYSITNVSQKLWCTKIEREKNCVNVCRPLQEFTQFLNPFQLTSPWIIITTLILSTNHCISDSFQSDQILEQSCLLQWPIGQDLPAIEGHGGLRPGKCQTYQEFKGFKELFRCKGKST